MRRLPGIDRCVMAQGLYYVIEDKAPVGRTYTFRNELVATTVPVTVADDSIDGLGGDFAISVYGRGYGVWRVGGLGTHGTACFGTYVEQKLHACRAYAASPNSLVETMFNNFSC
ncbi:MAG: hypothetical protein M1486_04805 [Gammaproteobacteria bacterium]|nr:hypothetical protein [Gammaproteobacteria bacterium]